MDELSAKRTLGTTNDLDDDAHRHQDKLVLDDILDFDDSGYSGAFGLAILLTTIVSSSEGKLDSKFEKVAEVKALFREHPELAEKLEEAWAARSFKEIRNLSALSYFEDQL